VKLIYQMMMKLLSWMVLHEAAGGFSVADRPPPTPACNRP
jgi:hypothetical protein